MSKQENKKNLKLKLNQKTTTEPSKKSSTSTTNETVPNPHLSSSTSSSQDTAENGQLSWEDGVNKSSTQSQEKVRLKLTTPMISNQSLPEEEKEQENTSKKYYAQNQQMRMIPTENSWNNSSKVKKTENSPNLSQAQLISKQQKNNQTTLKNTEAIATFSQKPNQLATKNSAVNTTLPTLSELEAAGVRDYRVSSKDGSLYSVLIVNNIEIQGSFRRHRESELVSMSEKKYGIVNNMESENYGRCYSFLKNIHTGERMRGSWQWIEKDEYERVFGIKSILSPSNSNNDVSFMV